MKVFIAANNSGGLYNFRKELIEEIGITEDIEEELEYAGFRSINEAFEVINTQNSSKKIIEALKGNDYIKLAKIGTNITVKHPPIPIDKLPIAPSTSPSSNALLVPTA